MCVCVCVFVCVFVYVGFSFNLVVVSHSIFGREMIFENFSFLEER
jgi:hypothetical protein